MSRSFWLNHTHCVPHTHTHACMQTHTWSGCEPAGGAVASALACSSVCRPLPDWKKSCWREHISSALPGSALLCRGKTLIQLLWENPVSGVSGAEDITAAATDTHIPFSSLSDTSQHTVWTLGIDLQSNMAKSINQLYRLKAGLQWCGFFCTRFVNLMYVWHYMKPRLIIFSNVSKQ